MDQLLNARSSVYSNELEVAFGLEKLLSRMYYYCLVVKYLGTVLGIIWDSLCFSPHNCPTRLLSTWQRSMSSYKMEQR